MRGVKRIYLIAGVISLVLYIAGIATGYLLQGDISGIVAGEIDQVREDISTVEQELPLLSLRGEGSCSILSTLSTDVNGRLNSILNNIIELENQGASGENYDKLVNDYTSLTVRGWILDKDIKQSCNENTLPTLYFYSVPCDDCLAQGEIITELRNKYGNKFSVFVLNAGIDQSAIKILTKSFNIDKTPALIIDSVPFQGFISKEDLENVICKELNEC